MVTPVAERPGVLVYFETGKAIKGLDYETKGRLFEAILEYAEMGITPNFDGVLSAIWPFVADKIDRDSVRYADIREKNRIKGLVSNFKRNYAPAHGIDPEDKEALAKYLAEQTPATVNNGRQQSTTVDLWQPIQPTTTSTIATTATSTTTSTAAATIAADVTVGVEGCSRDTGIREVASAPSDTDEIDFETKRQIALKRMRESYGQGL